MQLREYQTQMIETLRKQFGKGFKKTLAVLPCGAGKTVCFADMANKHIQKNNDNYVWFLVHRQELVDQTLETFQKMNLSIENIFIGMVQTVSRHLEDYKRPTIIIFDEAHHAKAKTWNKIIQRYDNVPIIGLTATPIRQDGKPLGDIFDVMVEGVNINWLIEKGYLCPFDYYAPDIGDMKLTRKGNDYDMDEFTEYLLDSRIYGDVEKYIDLNKKTIIYCPSIKFSKTLCEKIGAVHFDGNTPKNERRTIVKKFKNGEIKILSNVDLIGEGFDVPDCDCVMLLRPTRSLALYIQQSTRCLRPAEGKRATIYDFVGNVHRHGLPTVNEEWSLTHSKTIKNENGEKDILCRRCKKCLRVYSGTQKICPFCGNDNGMTERQIKQQQEVELKKIEETSKKRRRMEIGMARNYQELVVIGRKRGYKNPEYWARMIINSRHHKI